MWRWNSERQISCCLGYRSNKEFSSPQIFIPMQQGVQDHNLNLELSLREPKSLTGIEHACPLAVLLHTRMTCMSWSFRLCGHPPALRGEHFAQPRHEVLLQLHDSRFESAHVGAVDTFSCLYSIRLATYSYRNFVLNVPERWTSALARSRARRACSDA